MCEDPEQPVYSCPPPLWKDGEGCRLKTHTGCQIGKKQIDRIEGIVEWKTREESRNWLVFSIGYARVASSSTLSPS
ncbi:hypothetical protein CEXT_783221 [Caerostris extrusa]|uniref:Uncharacterized protein n=1 Tax=Caerostris extrusa TaxID=172846 RepID=A0AAV4XW48_CAEEX|nr:hypothetical protein CEXT_783221 [Caerostris extrusa]